MVRCPWCNSVMERAAALLGALGVRRHYRCRYCGGMWSRVSRPRRKKKEAA